MTGAPYPPGHEYEVPPVSMPPVVDAGCAPAAHSGDDGGAVFCEMDGGAS
jgi:hypothetical protein